VYHVCAWLPALGLLTAWLPDLESDGRERRVTEPDVGAETVTMQ